MSITYIQYSVAIIKIIETYSNFDYIPVPAGGSGFERLRFENDSESEEVCITILNDTRGCEGPETFSIILDANPADSNPCGDEVIITITDTRKL